MSLRRYAVAVMILLGVALAPAAASAADSPDRPSLLLAWTSVGPDSYRAWDAARTDPERRRGYHFDWSTDYCTGGPDQPHGYDFRLACWRHDFGYRNYRAGGGLRPHKDRIDAAFYADMMRVCDRQPSADRRDCARTARAYHWAVRIFGGSKVQL
ncbi:phospholipase [Virgisporangium aurantiacum]|uniref:Phospholipase A2 n=1 Tax=Virgisporangium aurantiacum TaxID=175570 RepID=A0A8J4E1Z2_9ACTN|nr:phospholipase [Virgisporangium aurantiacum]GIJ56487.1 hypothetical protein Vau01_040030 [Virgisporangium aurantiacum]